MTWATILYLHLVIAAMVTAECTLVAYYSRRFKEPVSWEPRPAYIHRMEASKCYSPKCDCDFQPGSCRQRPARVHRMKVYDECRDECVGRSGLCETCPGR